METESLFEKFYEYLPFFLLLVDISILAMGAMGQSRTRRPGWTLIMLCGGANLLSILLSLGLRYKIIEVDTMDSRMTLALVITGLELLGWLFLVLGLYRLLNESGKSSSSLLDQ